MMNNKFGFKICSFSANCSVGLGLLFLLFFTGCSFQSEQVEAPAGDEILASYGEREVTVQDIMTAFQESIDFDSFALKDPREDTKQTLSGLSNFIVKNAFLSDKAREQKLDQTEEIQQYRQDILESELSQKIIVEDVLKTISVSEDEIKAFYEENKDPLLLMKDSNFYRIRGIYTLKNQHPQGKAEELIYEAYKKLEQGLRFESVAKDYSDAPSYMQGDANEVSPKILGQEGLEALQSLEDGEYSGVMDWGDKYMILKREAYEPPRYVPLDEARKTIVQQLVQQKKERKLFQLMESLKQKHTVFVNDALLELDDVEDPSLILLRIPNIRELRYEAFVEKAQEEGAVSKEDKQQLLNRMMFESLCYAEALFRGWGAKDVEQPLKYWLERKLSETYLIKNLGKVSNERIQEVYEEKQGTDLLKTPKYVELSHLFFRIPSMMQATRYEQRLFYQSAMAKAKQAYQEVMNGRPFEEVIALYATSDSNEVTGGSLGRIDLRDMSPSRQNMIKGLKVGETSEPKKISNLSDNRFGYELFHIDSITEPQPLPKEEGLKVVAQYLAQQRYLEKKKEVEKNFFDESKPVFYDPVLQNSIDYLLYLKKHPDKHVELAQYMYGEKGS